MDGYEAIGLLGYEAIGLLVVHGPWNVKLVGSKKLVVQLLSP